MATAQELFSLTNATEEHIVVGADRYITVPEPLKRIAVQFDHDVETVTFDCPRYWDDLDMSTMTVYINYKLPNGDLDAYPAKNIKADGDIMRFDWTISNKVTQYKGNLTFLVCVKKTGTDGVEVNHWNSELCTDMYISEGMECEEQTQLEYSDLITQLLERMTVVEQINVQADEMREIHDEVLSETTGIRQTSANAIKGSARGEIIQIDDVSPVEHNVKVLVNKSKNLYALNSTLGVGNYSARQDVYITTPITLSLKKTDDFTTSSNIWRIQFVYADGTYIYWLDGTMLLKTISATEDNPIVQIAVREQYITAGSYYDIQIELGDTATNYEPYIDPTTVTVKGCNKNLVPFGQGNYYAGRKQTINGVTFVVNEDGSVTANGTATAGASFQIKAPTNSMFSKGTHTVVLSGCPEGGAGNTYCMRVKNDVTAYDNMDEYGTGKVIDDFSFEGCDIYCVVFGGVTVNNITFYPQIEFGEIPTEYEPGNITTYTPAADGSVDVKSVAPFMQIFTDTPGVTLDCEYNKDIQKVAGINVNRYEFSIQQLDDIYTKYQTGNRPISMVRCELNSLPALRITYRLYTATISGGVVTKLFDIPVKYNPNANTTLYEQPIPNASEFKCGFVKISDTWVDFNSLIESSIYSSSFHQTIECRAWIQSSGVHGVAHSQTISFDTTEERDAMATQINALISATTKVAWEHTPINKIIITPKYLGE